MQLNKQKDNPQLNRQRLAQIVVKSFNKKVTQKEKLYNRSAFG